MRNHTGVEQTAYDIAAVLKWLIGDVKTAGSE
jgi:hypothetical protein